MACPISSTTVSVTTRGPRKDEIDGEDYYFLAREDFEKRRDNGEFMEWAEVHENLYGTLNTEVERCLASGNDVILELDVQGMRSLKKVCPEAVNIFILPPSVEELEHRLRTRGTDDDEVVKLRLNNAKEEMAAKAEFDYIVINDEVERAAADMSAILRAERCRSHRFCETE